MPEAKRAKVRLQVTGWSMAPLLQPGDWIHVLQAAPSAIRRGDVATFWYGGALVTHRVLRAGGGAWLLKGDANIAPDAPVQPPALLGRAICRERGGVRCALDTPFWALAGGALGWLGWRCATLPPPLALFALRCCRLATRVIVAFALPLTP